MKDIDSRSLCAVLFISERIENLKSCVKLKSLNLQHNNIDYVSNLYTCLQLWKIDLSSNKV